MSTDDVDMSFFIPVVFKQRNYLLHELLKSMSALYADEHMLGDTVIITTRRQLHRALDLYFNVSFVLYFNCKCRSEVIPPAHRHLDAPGKWHYFLLGIDENMREKWQSRPDQADSIHLLATRSPR